MRTLLGFLIVLLGLGFLLQQLDVSWADRLTNSWWPIVIIAVGVYSWNSNRRMWFGAGMIVFVGLVLLLDQLNAFNQSAWTLFWPIVIILIGGRILMGKRWDNATKVDTGAANANVLFSGLERKVTGEFRQGDLSAWFGGITLDLREAQFADESVLNVTAGFGGIDITVPKHVRVITNVAPILGGSEDKTNPDAGASKTLTIRGSAMFGGVSIKN